MLINTVNYLDDTPLSDISSDILALNGSVYDTAANILASAYDCAADYTQSAVSGRNIALSGRRYCQRGQ